MAARFLRYTRTQLLSGGNYDIDVDDLKNNTRYTGGYNEGSRTIKIFWEVFASQYYIYVYDFHAYLSNLF